MKLASGAAVKDGGSSLSLQIESINPGERVSFTIDVDDTLPVSSLGIIVERWLRHLSVPKVASCEVIITSAKH